MMILTGTFVAKKDCKKLANDLYEHAIKWGDSYYEYDSDDPDEPYEEAVNKMTEYISFFLDKKDENIINSLHTKLPISLETRKKASEIY